TDLYRVSHEVYEALRDKDHNKGAMEERTISEWMAATSAKDRNEITGNMALRLDQGTLAPQTMLKDLQRRLHNTEDVLSYRAGIKEVLTSLSLLVNMDSKFLKSDSSEIVKALFSLAKRDTLREQKAATRLVLFQLLETLLRRHESTLLRDIGREEFVKGLVAVAEFEKDPSCLNILFEMYTELGSDLSPESAKNIWESYIRYFPIKMGGNARDESKPSIEQLKGLLLRCFVSSDLYAEWAFPRLIEQLDVDQDLTANVKMDVLETIATCASTYSPQVVAQWSTKVYDALKFEVLNGTNEDFIEGALKIFRRMTGNLEKLLQDWKNDDDIFVKYVVDISRQCVQRLHEPEHKFVQPCGRILAALASTSPIAFHIVIRSTVSVLLVIWQDLETIKDKRQFLDLFNLLFQARLDAGKAIDINPKALEPTKYLARKAAMVDSLAAYRERLTEIYFGSMAQEAPSNSEEIQYRIETIKGLTLLARVPDFLTGYAKNTVFDILTATALDLRLDQKVYDESVTALQTISIEDPDAFRDIVLLNFFHKLPDVLSTDKDAQKAEIKTNIQILGGITKIACTSTCKVELAGGPPANAVTNHKYRLFDELVVKQKSHENEPLATKGEWYIGLQELPVGSNEQTNNSASEVDMVAYDDFFIQLVGKVATLALRSQRTTPLNNFLLNYDEEHLDDPSQVWALFCPEIQKSSLTNSQLDLQYGPAEKCTANILSMSLMAGLRREDKSRLRVSIGDTAAAMLRNAISRTSQASVPARIAILEFLQLLINKFVATKENITGDERKLFQIMKDEVEGCSSKSEEEANNVFQTLAYFTAAAIARYDETTPALIQLMLNELTSTTRGRRVAQSFRILLVASPTMNEQNFCVIRPLRIGRVFELVVPKIISIWKENGAKDIKINCSIALAAVLSNMPISLVAPRAEEITPLILE
ncbi:hypothetical protein DH86_00003646, partial [Scytalidium sp. 3C]